MKPKISLSAPRVLVVFLLFLLVFAAALPLGAADKIRLGEIDPLSGHLAKPGLEIHQGILYAVEEANARGNLIERAAESALLKLLS